MKKTFLIFSACFVLILSGCQNISVNSLENNKNTNNEPAAGLANPASANCIAKGGKLEMRKNKLGEYGVCLFEDNRQCEEWALFRGQCPEGGVKITDNANAAEVYCVITGGQVVSLEKDTLLCKRIDGTLCTIQANFDGECPDPNDPNPNAGNVEAQ